MQIQNVENINISQHEKFFNNFLYTINVVTTISILYTYNKRWR